MASNIPTVQTPSSPPTGPASQPPSGLPSSIAAKPTDGNAPNDMPAQDPASPSSAQGQGGQMPPPSNMPATPPMQTSTPSPQSPIPANQTPTPLSPSTGPNLSTPSPAASQQTSGTPSPPGLMPQQPLAPPTGPISSTDDTAARFSSRDSSVSGGSQSQKPADTDGTGYPDEPQTAPAPEAPPSPAVGIEQRAPVDAPQPIKSTSSEVDTGIDPDALSSKRFPDDLSSTWRRTKCLNCGYVHEGEAQMTRCPKCGNSDPDKFGEAE